MSEILVNTIKKADGTGSITVPAETGTVLTSASDIIPNSGALFEARMSAAQNLSSAVFVKVPMDTEIFDLDGSYDSATNYRFQPTVSGYYQINGQLYIGSTALTVTLASIFKNGSRYKDGTYIEGTYNSIMLEVNVLVEMNGSTDYLEIYGYAEYSTGTAVVQAGGEIRSRWSGYLVRKS